jgi:hypothetical protein
VKVQVAPDFFATKCAGLRLERAFPEKIVNFFKSLLAHFFDFE